MEKAPSCCISMTRPENDFTFTPTWYLPPVLSLNPHNGLKKTHTHTKKRKDREKCVMQLIVLKLHMELILSSWSVFTEGIIN